MASAAVVLAAAIFLSYPTGQTLTADIDAVVAAGKVTSNQYNNDYFALTVTADDGVIQAPSLKESADSLSRTIYSSGQTAVAERRLGNGSGRVSHRCFGCRVCWGSNEGNCQR
jgi:hypothetical protein